MAPNPYPTRPPVVERTAICLPPYHPPMMATLARRLLTPEQIDDPSLDPAEHRKALFALGRINRLSRIANTLWRHIHRYIGSASDTHCMNRPVRVLDIGTGGGDIPIVLSRIAARRGVELELHGCDISPTALAHARAQAAAHNAPVQFWSLDPSREALPLSCDIAISNLLLHHLDDERITALLHRLALAGTHQLHCDLRRCRRGLALAWLGTRLISRCRMTHVDGPHSVRRALRPDEALERARRAGLNRAIVHRAWPARLVLEVPRA